MFGEKEELELKEIKEKLDTIDKKKNELSKGCRDLKRRQLELRKEKARLNIGRCFKEICDGKAIRYWRIINIDKTYYHLTGVSFNEYQYPSLVFNVNSQEIEMIPFYEESLFSGVWGQGNSYLIENTFIEITKEEWIAEFKRINNEWIKRLE